jgi:hypothetical protein
MSDIVLGKNDVQYIKRHRGADAISFVTEKVMFYFNNQKFSDSEKIIAEDIFDLLTHSSHLSIRKILSENLACSPELPHKIALKLANDTADVAKPMIMFSPILRDDDLVNLLNQTNQIAPKLAIARRRNISEMICGELIKTNNSLVVSTMLENVTAKVNDEHLFMINELFDGNKDVMEALDIRSFSCKSPDCLDKIGNFFKGGLNHFIEHVADATEMPLLNAKVLLRKPDGSGFRFLFEKLEIPVELIEPSYVIYNQLIKNEVDKRNRTIEEILYKLKQQQAPVPYMQIVMKAIRQKITPEERWY